jgi:hypothetical protein
VTLLHNFPGIRGEDISRALGLSVYRTNETLAILLRGRHVRQASDRYMSGWASAGAWDPDAELTAEGLEPDWPRESGPLGFPGEGALL